MRRPRLGVLVGVVGVLRLGRSRKITPSANHAGGQALTELRSRGWRVADMARTFELSRPGVVAHQA